MQLMPTNSREADAPKTRPYLQIMKDILGYEIWVNIFSTTVFYEELNNLTALFAR